MTHDLISVTIIMAGAVLCPIIADRIPGKAIPQTVLLLLFGAVLGPHLLNRIWLTDATELLSELGLAFLFLLAGYEINPRQLGGHQGRVGLVTWLFTLAIAWGVVLAVPFFSSHDMSGVASVIALTTTALGTLMPILKERSLEGTPVDNAIIAYGTWGELGPVLAMAVLLSTRSRWQTVLILGIFTAVCVAAALAPRIARRVGTRLFDFFTANANTSSQTLMRLTILLLVALITLSRLFNLDVVLGAFAAGFILRFVVPHGIETLDLKLQGVAYGFLIPVFFVVSGATIDVHAVAANPLLLVVFIVMLLLIRAVPVFIATTLDRKRNPLNVAERISVAVYCTTALPVIVAVTSVAVDAGTMREDTASTLVAAGAVTVFVMPLIGGLIGTVLDRRNGRTSKTVRKA